MPEYRVTFGSQYGGQDYGADPHPVGGYDHVHRNGWWTIVAPDMDAARTLVVAVLGTGWSSLYDPVSWELFPRGELLRLVHPAMATQVVHLLTGPIPPGLVDHMDMGEHDAAQARLLVTVWGNGNAEVAWREEDNPRVGWGIPSELTPAP